jgi:hypothetical protein
MARLKEYKLYRFYAFVQLRFLGLLFQARIVRISSYTIRAIQNAIITGTSLFDLMRAIMARLVPG